MLDSIRSYITPSGSVSPRRVGGDSFDADEVSDACLKASVDLSDAMEGLKKLHRSASPTKKINVNDALELNSPVRKSISVESSSPLMSSRDRYSSPARQYSPVRFRPSDSTRSVSYEMRAGLSRPAIYKREPSPDRPWKPAGIAPTTPRNRTPSSGKPQTSGLVNWVKNRYESLHDELDDVEHRFDIAMRAEERELSSDLSRKEIIRISAELREERALLEKRRAVVEAQEETISTIMAAFGPTRNTTARRHGSHRSVVEQPQQLRSLK